MQENGKVWGSVWNSSIGDVLSYMHPQGVCQEFPAAVAVPLETVFCPNPLPAKRSGRLSPSHFFLPKKPASFHGQNKNLYVTVYL